MVFGEIGDPFTPSRIAAAFAVVEDAPISLGVGGDIDRTFEFRLDPHVRAAGQVIVSFLLIRAESLQLEVTLNELSYTRDYSSGPERTVHENIGAAAQLANRLTLRVIQGSCRISDLVVWYQIQA
jgi:hypothetical protein